MTSAAATVIVCVYNRPDQILACLQSLLSMDFPCPELVVVDDGSTDHTPQQLAEFDRVHPEANIKVVRNHSNLGVSGARNAGLDVATGRLVAFTDSDCTVDPGWLSALSRCFADPGVAAVSGHVIDAPPRTWAECSYVGTCRVGHGKLPNRPLIGNNMCFRLDLATSLRFEQALAYGCDEDELAWRLASLGYSFGYAPDAVVYHNHAMNLRGYLALAKRQGQGSARFWYKRGNYIGRDLMFLVAAMATLPLSLWNSSFLALPGALLLLQLVALLVNEVAFKGKRLLQGIAVLPISFLFITVKAWSVLSTLLRIALGREPEILHSRRHWRLQRKGGTDET